MISWRGRSGTFVCISAWRGMPNAERSKGRAGAAGAFGGGGTQTAFGARGATTLLHKLTTGAFIGFILLSLALTVLQARQRPSVVRGVPQKTSAQGAAPAVPKPAPAGGVQATGQKQGGAPVSAQAPVAPAPVAPAQAPARKK